MNAGSESIMISSPNGGSQGGISFVLRRRRE
jgi:hypothetical protein